MLKILSVDFDSSSWEKHGVNWARNVKSKGCDGLVIDCGLSPSMKAKINDYKFRVVRPADGILGKYSAIAQFVGDNDKCLYSTKLMEPEDVFFEDDKMICKEENLRLANLVVPIVRLWKRVEAANAVESALSHGLLGTEAICATGRDWKLFVSLFDFLVESGFMDARWRSHEKIILNLFGTYFNSRVKVIK